MTETTEAERIAAWKRGEIVPTITTVEGDMIRHQHPSFALLGIPGEPDIAKGIISHSKGLRCGECDRDDGIPWHENQFGRTIDKFIKQGLALNVRQHSDGRVQADIGNHHAQGPTLFVALDRLEVYLAGLPASQAGKWNCHCCKTQNEDWNAPCTSCGAKRLRTMEEITAAPKRPEA